MIGARLKEERNRLKLTQPQFAEAAGAAKRTLIEWEKGETSPSAVQLSALRGVGVDVLYVLTGERERADTETQDEFIDRMQAIKVTGAIVDALPLPEPEREGLKLCLTGDPKKDADSIAAALIKAEEPDSVESTSPVTYGRGKVVPMTLNEHATLTQQEVLRLVLDALHAARRTLPSEKVMAVVDAVMAWQRAGVGVTKSSITEQLRMAQ